MSHSTSGTWTQSPNLARYADALRETDRLFADEDYERALDLLEATWPGLPSAAPDVRLIEVLILKAYCLAKLRRPADALGVFQAMLHCGLSSNLSSPAYDPLRELPGYAQFARENEVLLDGDWREARAVIDVHLPRDLPRDAKAPLFLILHGEPGNLTTTRDVWPTDAVVARGVVAAYLQSSQLRSAGRFVWSRDRAKAQADIREAVHTLCREYPADADRVILGGFSAGATAALDALLSRTVPAAGFICLCAGDRPESLTPENLAMAKSTGVRGVFFEGQRNWPDEEEAAMLAAMREADLPVGLVINEGCAHEAPPDFAAKIQRALDFVLDGRRAA